jgi:hypothetical protein
VLQFVHLFQLANQSDCTKRNCAFFDQLLKIIQAETFFQGLLNGLNLNRAITKLLDLIKQRKKIHVQFGVVKDLNALFRMRFELIDELRSLNLLLERLVLLKETNTVQTRN